MRDHSRLIALILVVAAVVVSAIAYPHLPAIIPTHWGLSGQADGFSSRLTGVLIMPLAMVGIWILFILLPRYDRALFVRYEQRESDVSTVQPVYGVIVVVVMAIMLAIHVIALTSALGVVGASRQPLLFAALASVGSILIGNYMPRVTRRNAFIGFRVPWAYASEEVWRRTQRAGGYGMVFSGVVGLIGAFVFPTAPLKPLFVAMILQIVVVMIYSFRLAHSSNVP